MLLLECLLSGAVLVVLVPVSVLFAETFLAVAPRDKSSAPGGVRGRVAIVMPAHNERSTIAVSLRAIIPELSQSDRLLVVADNCSDETASIAVAEGAEAVIRTDVNRRGKGYALDFGIRHLSLDPPDIVVIIDADCRVGAGAIDRLARQCEQFMRPMQALYLMNSPNDPSLGMRMAEFAWNVKNKVRPLGLHRLGLPCQLMGSGMAFPWQCISVAQLATGHIVEDLRLGIDIALAGTPALFCPEALVMSEFPVSAEGIRGQRTRWEHGHLMVILADAPRLLLNAIASRNRDLLALALDLMVPPLALLALAAAIVWIASAGFWVFGQSLVPLGMATATLTLFALSVLLSWWRFGRHIISLRMLLLAPFYIIWKIPLYFRFVLSRQLEWVRSKRDDEKS
jgi:cellulose synthase/poly-beta-1,6-N-acetylglucosamine synthase-like glycosyltransferase